MALNIKDPETDRLARALSEETGESITVAARKAFEERLVRVRARAAVQPHREELRTLIERGRRRAVVDPRPAEEILGYDQHGLPS